MFGSVGGLRREFINVAHTFKFGGKRDYFRRCSSQIHSSEGVTPRLVRDEDDYPWAIRVDSGLGVQQGSLSLFPRLGDQFVRLLSGLLNLPQLSLVRVRLPLYTLQGLDRIPNAQDSDNDQRSCKCQREPINPVSLYRHGGKFADAYGLMCILGGYVAGFLLVYVGSGRLWDGHRLSGWILFVLGVLANALATISASIGCRPWDWGRRLHDSQQHSYKHRLHRGSNVTQKYFKIRTLPQGRRPEVVREKTICRSSARGRSATRSN